LIFVICGPCLGRHGPKKARRALGPGWASIFTLWAGTARPEIFLGRLGPTPFGPKHDGLGPCRPDPAQFPALVGPLGIRMRSLSARTQRGEGDVDALRAARATGSARPSRRFPNPPATAVIDSCSLHQTRGESCTSRVAASTRSWRIRPHPVQPSSSPAPAAEQVPLPSPSTPLVQRLGLRSRS